jgi:hypothetical protein
MPPNCPYYSAANHKQTIPHLFLPRRSRNKIQQGENTMGERKNQTEPSKDAIPDSTNNSAV